MKTRCLMIELSNVPATNDGCHKQGPQNQLFLKQMSYLKFMILSVNNIQSLSHGKDIKQLDNYLKTSLRSFVNIICIKVINNRRLTIYLTVFILAL